jgi:predicted 2-oxoglutarate/Fe(II)-dependent dioxygenase YbiX
MSGLAYYVNWITVYTDNAPSVVEGNISSDLAFSLSNYYWTDEGQDAQDGNPVVHGPFGNVNVAMTGEVFCEINWTQGQYPVRILK